MHNENRFLDTFRGHSIPMNSKLNWNDNLAAIFEAKLTFKGLQVQSPSIVFVGAVDTICLGMPRFSVFILI